MDTIYQSHPVIRRPGIHDGVLFMRHLIHKTIGGIQRPHVIHPSYNTEQPYRRPISRRTDPFIPTPTSTNYRNTALMSTNAVRSQSPPPTDPPPPTSEPRTKNHNPSSKATKKITLRHIAAHTGKSPSPQIHSFQPHKIPIRTISRYFQDSPLPSPSRQIHLSSPPSPNASPLPNTSSNNLQ